MGGTHGRAGAGSASDLATLVERRLEALRVHAGPAREGTVEAVHQARVASRRLREVVPVLGRGLDDITLKPLRRALRDMTRALGPVRELDVALGMVAALPLETPDAQRLRTAWQRHLDGQRREPVRALRTALSADRRRTLVRDLERFAAVRAASDDQTWRDALARRLADRAGTLRAHIVRTGIRYQPGPLHEVRIAAKQLRYALEITAEAGLARLVVPLRTLKQAQDALGHLHDLDVLLTRLQAVPGAAPGEALQHAAAAAIAELERESQALHGRYLRSRQALLRVIDTTLAVLVPRVRPPAPPRSRKAHHAR